MPGAAWSPGGGSQSHLARAAAHCVLWQDHDFLLVIVIENRCRSKRRGLRLERSRLAAATSTVASSTPSAGVTATTRGVRSVNVPVLSTSNVSILSNRSRGVALWVELESLAAAEHVLVSGELCTMTGVHRHCHPAYRVNRLRYAGHARLSAQVPRVVFSTAVMGLLIHGEASPPSAFRIGQSAARPCPGQAAIKLEAATGAKGITSEGSMSYGRAFPFPCPSFRRSPSCRCNPDFPSWPGSASTSGCGTRR